MYVLNLRIYIFFIILADVVLLIFLLIVFTGNHVHIKNERGFWRTLFCCFGKSRNRLNSSFAPTNNACGATAKPDGNFTPPLSPDLSQSSYLLPAIRHQDMHKKCMVIDLDETLVHSSFKVNINVCLSYLS